MPRRALPAQVQGPCRMRLKQRRRKDRRRRRWPRQRTQSVLIVGAGLCNPLTIMRLKILRRCVGRGKP
eukprot:4007721-Pleurochrysis_carterae.AAC.1